MASATVRRRIFNKTGGRCFYCGGLLGFDSFHVDHFIPKKLRGKGGDNLVPSCPDCNIMKCDKTIEEFRASIKSILHNTLRGRIVAKYFLEKEADVVFWYERNRNGNI